MQLGMIGLGRMGSNMAQRLLAAGHQIVAFDHLVEAVETLENQGAIGSGSIHELVSKMTPPRAVWLMVPSGEPTEKTTESLAAEMVPGDVIIDGGNSYYKDSIRRSQKLSEQGIHFLDVGVSGGIWGLKEGYSLMVGGNKEAYESLIKVFQSLAPSPEFGYGHVGISGAGHFVKMVHNGIEYGLMEAYAEGFELMQAKQEFNLNLHQIAHVWRYGTVIRSWLLDLTAAALEEDPQLNSLEAYVEDTGEGRWTVQESIDLSVPIPVITQSLQARFRSRQEQPFGARLLAAVRNQFGGHKVHTRET